MPLWLIYLPCHKHFDYIEFQFFNNIYIYLYMNIDFYSKYIKYKTKYLSLQNNNIFTEDQNNIFKVVLKKNLHI